MITVSLSKCQILDVERMEEKARVTKYSKSYASRTAIMIVFENYRLIGGICTLTKTISSRFESMGYRTLVCGNFSKDIRDQFANLDLRTCDLKGVYDFKDVEEFYFKNDVDQVLILTFSANGAAIADRALRHLRSPHIDYRLLLGVYHPRVFPLDLRRPVSSMLNYLWGRSISYKSVYFMNQECRTSNVKSLGVKYERCAIINLPVEILNMNWVAKERQVKIVSVGRITSFKAYNFSAAKIIKELRDDGINVTWDIYGHGEDEAELLKLATHCPGLRFMGQLNPEDFSKIGLEYDLFIGMGTAAIQSASLGLPTLLAVDELGDWCHGYVFDAPPGNVGEKTNESKYIRVFDAILKFNSISMSEKDFISKKCRYWAESFAGHGEDEIIELLKSAAIPSAFSKFICRIFFVGLSMKSRLSGRAGAKKINFTEL